MKIAVWKTGHEIADTVVEAVYEGLSGHERISCICGTMEWCEADIHIGYGILRGMEKVFRKADETEKPWFNIDRGYWKPGHYDGYYRVSLCGTQQTFGLDKLEPDYERWDKLGLEILPAKERSGQQLFCPPSSYVASFFPKSFMRINPPVIERYKGCQRPLQGDLDACSNVVTFNSSVGWEALRQGIPVISDPNHSIIGAYQKMLDRPIRLDVDERRRLFAIQSGLQLTLSEIRDGHLWPLLQKLLPLCQSTSAGIAAKA